MHPRTLEIRMRRTLDRRGYQLRKSRRRDPYAPDYGGYWITDARTNTLIAGGEFGMSLDDVVAWVNDMEAGE